MREARKRTTLDNTNKDGTIEDTDQVSLQIDRLCQVVDTWDDAKAGKLQLKK